MSKFYEWEINMLDGFSFWCSTFHTKYHCYVDDPIDGFYRKHKCHKCGVVYSSPNVIKEDVSHKKAEQCRCGNKTTLHVDCFKKQDEIEDL